MLKNERYVCTRKCCWCCSFLPFSQAYECDHLLVYQVYEYEYSNWLCTGIDFVADGFILAIGFAFVNVKQVSRSLPASEGPELVGVVTLYSCAAATSCCCCCNCCSGCGCGCGCGCGLRFCLYCCLMCTYRVLVPGTCTSIVQGRTNVRIKNGRDCPAWRPCLLLGANRCEVFVGYLVSVPVWNDDAEACTQMYYHSHNSI